MNQQATDTSAVRSSITVAVPIERAWEVWTTGMSSWWPAGHHIASEPFEDAVLEPRAGGRWYERAASGAECDWGVVRAWEPPTRLVVTWQIGSDWKFDPDPAHASEVEVRFTAEGDGATRIDLEHSGFENHADGGVKLRASVGEPDGWGGILRVFAEAAVA